MKLLITILLIFCTGNSFAQFPSFNCKRAKSPQEKQICRSPYLAVLDGLISKLYQQKIIEKKDQQEWLKKRNIILGADKLTKVLEERVNEKYPLLLQKKFAQEKEATGQIKAELGNLSQSSVILYLFIINSENKKANDILLAIQNPIETFLSTENLHIGKDAIDASAEIEILDINNDGSLDIVAKSFQGRELWFYITDLCFETKKGLFEACKESAPIPSSIKDGSGWLQASLYFGSNANFYFTKNKFVFGDGNYSERGTLQFMCDETWINDVVRRAESNLETYYKNCKELKNKDELLYGLAKKSISENKFDECRQYLKQVKLKDERLESFRVQCAFHQIPAVDLKKMSFVELCSKDDRVLDEKHRSILSFIFSEENESASDKKPFERTKEVCDSKFDSILKKKELTINGCRVADINDLKFITLFKGIESLQIVEGGSRPCREIGRIKEDIDWSPISTLKLKELIVSYNFLDNGGSDYLWEFLRTAKISKVIIPTYPCEVVGYKLFVTRATKDTKFICDDKNTEFDSSIKNIEKIILEEKPSAPNFDFNYEESHFDETRVQCQDKKNAEACFLGGYLYSSHFYNDFKSSYSYYEAACNLKHPVGCYNLAGLILLKWSHDETLSALKKSCDLGFQKGCNYYSALKSYKKTNKDYYADIFSKVFSTDLKERIKLGESYSLKALSAPKGSKELTENLKNACRLKHIKSCKQLGFDFAPDCEELETSGSSSYRKNNDAQKACKLLGQK